MRIGRLYVRLGRSLGPYPGLDYIDGRKFQPLYMRSVGNTVIYGQGGVLTLGWWLLWWQWETHRKELS